MNIENLNSEGLIERVSRELRKQFPKSEVHVTRNSKGMIVAYIDGVKVIDMERILDQFKNLPIPKRGSEPEI